jgi:hypothetical protein
MGRQIQTAGEFARPHAGKLRIPPRHRDFSLFEAAKSAFVKKFARARKFRTDQKIRIGL